jgi:predicted RNA-binding Zn-ribbon protein involved in translation (DUF1610 family)
MGSQQRQTFCPSCDRLVLGIRQKPSHVLHLLLSVITMGLWLIPWFLISVFSSGSKYKCPNCGSDTLTYLPRGKHHLKS